MSAYSSCVNVRGSLTNRSVTRHSQLKQSTTAHLTQWLLHPAAALLSTCCQANTHPPPHSVSTDQVSRYGDWTVCCWVGESAGKNNACNANDKPPSKSPASWFRTSRFTRGCVRELKNAHNSVTVQNRTHVHTNFFA